jgi:chemosensory pili system protein ChpC
MTTTRTTNRRTKETKRVLRTSGRSPELHCMLIPVEEESLLLPTSVISEVVDYSNPLPMEDAPPWLLGYVEWENRQVPVFSFTALINGSPVGEVAVRSKIVILKSLAGSGRVPYLGVLLHGLPHAVTVKAEDLEQTGDDKKSLGVFSRVRVGEQDAIIPDIDRLTHLVTHAAYGALPITRLDD